MIGFPLLLLCTALHGAAAPPTSNIPPAAPHLVDYSREVRPILDRACFSCHGPEKQRGGLRLDVREPALQGGNTGLAIHPKDSAKSLLIRLVSGLEPERRMPPGKAKHLSPSEIGILRAWIDQGAHYPETKNLPSSPSPRSQLWSFQPVRRPALPAVQQTNWPRNPIDHFILARLERENLPPSSEADRITLLRRLFLDLLGLPPGPDEIEAFLSDVSPGAYERLVDRLLASPHYGERWGRHWLDLARYADSDGYEKDSPRPHAWRYRHWVISALNQDLPFDQFTIEQLAGDLLPHATLDQKVATGFHRNTLTNREGGVDPEQFRVEAVIDRVNTTASVWLGLTLGCAQCHDHKYDALSQREYYQFFAFFNSDVERDIPAPAIGVSPSALSIPIRKPKKGSPPAPSAIMAQTLALGPPRKTHVLIRGDFLRPGVEVQPGTPQVLPPLPDKTATRLHLARWLVHPQNPLTPRVTVNRIWRHFFGRGLVSTLEDFGTQGEKPSHPELLDWLALELQHHHWSLKALHRRIVTSATYRQSSHVRPDIQARDPYNLLLSRQSRHRLEAEVLRDSLLTSSGLLVRTIGGPSVRPPQPAGISELTYANSASWVESTGPDRYRRGLYTWFQRTSPYPMLLTFDAPDANLTCSRRERSNTPLQALTLLNDSAFLECARGLASRVLRQCKGDISSRLSYSFLLCTARRPSPTEQKRLQQLYQELHSLAEQDQDRAKALAAEVASTNPAEAAAWVCLARCLLNLDEVVTRE